MFERICIAVSGLTLIFGLAGSLTGCNATRAVAPVESYDTEPQLLPVGITRPALLLITKTNGYRHDEGIAAGVALFEAMAARRGWSILHTENAVFHNAAQLARFDAVVWHQTSGDILNEEQKQAFKLWLEQGGGFVGVHGAGGDPSYAWQWYVDTLIGAQFIGHTMGPQFQTATARVETRGHPATAQLPDAFEHEEEWYSFDRSVRGLDGFEVLVSVDESSYSPKLKFFGLGKDISMGDHPVVWSHCVGRGRALYSALGHQASAYASAEYAALLEGALAWALREEGEGCE
jgi:type 1 glutamine amidotransferase